jgi:predicted ArsR family transcriptional regulator
MGGARGAMTDDAVLVEFLRRSYQAVDGLWFVMVEEALDFGAALDMDRRVWEVLAKIQARKARELLGIEGHTPEELERGFSMKLRADAYAFESAVVDGGVSITITECPWLRILQRANRDHLAASIADVMCPTEGEAWAREFGDAYTFEVPEKACCGATSCRMRFQPKAG